MKLEMVNIPRGILKGLTSFTQGRHHEFEGGGAMH